MSQDLLHLDWDQLLALYVFAIDWQSLVNEAPQYGFLGGIVGITGVMLGATAAILYGFTRTFNDWKPAPDSELAGLDRMITGIVSVGVIALWLFAVPENVVTYIHLSFWLIGTGVVAFIFYIGLRIMCTCRKPRVNENNDPDGETRVWGGFWLTKGAKERGEGVTVCAFLAGNGFDKDVVWPRSSQALAAMSAAVVLLAIVAGGGAGLSAAATTAQVALTKKPAREIFSSSQVPGLPSPTPTPSPTPSRAPTPPAETSGSTPNTQSSAAPANSPS
jgi:hypothetical protein